MAKYKLLLPKMGESVAEATVIKWVKKVGDYIEADEAVMEIATDKVDSDVPSPVSGHLLEQLYKQNDVVQVGAVIAIIETAVAEEEPQIPSANPSIVPATQQNEVLHPIAENNENNQNGQYKEEVPYVPFTEQLAAKTISQSESTAHTQLRFYSPLVKNIAAHEGISNSELDQIPGTGADGRLTKDDLFNYIQIKQQKLSNSLNVNKEAVSDTIQPVNKVAVEHEIHSEAPATVFELPQSAPVKEEKLHSALVVETPQIADSKAEPVVNKEKSNIPLAEGDEIIEMDRMRRLIADHMVMSKQVSAHVTSFVEADVTNLVLWRNRVKDAFEKREGEKITFTPIFIEAVVRSIKDFPMINISVNGTQIIKKRDINIGMATALPNGNLIVPVIKKAEDLNLQGITKTVNDLASRARGNKLKPDDVQGGTFTITNVGTFGNVMGTPIINQPQVAILAIGAIKKKPVVIETLQGDMIGIRHMMFLSLSYDHRVVDGALGGMFVKRVADYLENWDTDREI